jgi:hypothetical protein
MPRHEAGHDDPEREHRSLPFALPSRSGVPGLHDRLFGDLAGDKLDHRRAKHARAVGVGAGLGERQALAVGHARSMLWVMARLQTSS